MLSHQVKSESVISQAGWRSSWTPFTTFTRLSGGLQEYSCGVLESTLKGSPRVIFYTCLLSVLEGVHSSSMPPLFLFSSSLWSIYHWNHRYPCRGLDNNLMLWTNSKVDLFIVGYSNENPNSRFLLLYSCHSIFMQTTWVADIVCDQEQPEQNILLQKHNNTNKSWNFWF